MKCPVCKSPIADGVETCPNRDCGWQFQIYLTDISEEEKKKHQKKLEKAKAAYQNTIEQEKSKIEQKKADEAKRQEQQNFSQKLHEQQATQEQPTASDGAEGTTKTTQTLSETPEEAKGSAEPGELEEPAKKEEAGRVNVFNRKNTIIFSCIGVTILALGLIIGKYYSQPVETHPVVPEKSVKAPVQPSLSRKVDQKELPTTEKALDNNQLVLYQVTARDAVLCAGNLGKELANLNRLRNAHAVLVEMLKETGKSRYQSKIYENEEKYNTVVTRIESLATGFIGNVKELCAAKPEIRSRVINDLQNKVNKQLPYEYNSYLLLEKQSEQCDVINKYDLDDWKRELNSTFSNLMN